MKQELTNEEIAKVFAMYWDGNTNPCKNCTSCLVLTPDGERQLIGFAFNKIYVRTWPENISPCSAYFTYDKNDCKLLLTPLSKITDEHAIEVCQIVSHASVYTYSVLRGLNFVQVVGEDQEGDSYGGTFYIFFDGTITWDWYNKDNQSGYEIKIFMAYQYLISQGYAVPLWFGIDHPNNGLTALELGIAVEKN